MLRQKVPELAGLDLCLLPPLVKGKQVRLCCGLAISTLMRVRSPDTSGACHVWQGTTAHTKH